MKCKLTAGSGGRVGGSRGWSTPQLAGITFIYLEINALCRAYLLHSTSLIIGLCHV